MVSLNDTRIQGGITANSLTVKNQIVFPISHLNMRTGSGNAWIALGASDHIVESGDFQVAYQSNGANAAKIAIPNLRTTTAYNTSTGQYTLSEKTIEERLTDLETLADGVIYGGQLQENNEKTTYVANNLGWCPGGLIEKVGAGPGYIYAHVFESIVNLTFWFNASKQKDLSKSSSIFVISNPRLQPEKDTHIILSVVPKDGNKQWYSAIIKKGSGDGGVYATIDLNKNIDLASKASYYEDIMSHEDLKGSQKTTAPGLSYGVYYTRSTT